MLEAMYYGPVCPKLSILINLLLLFLYLLYICIFVFQINISQFNSKCSQYELYKMLMLNQLRILLLL